MFKTLKILIVDSRASGPLSTSISLYRHDLGFTLQATAGFSLYILYIYYTYTHSDCLTQLGKLLQATAGFSLYMLTTYILYIYFIYSYSLCVYKLLIIHWRSGLNNLKMCGCCFLTSFTHFHTLSHRIRVQKSAVLCSFVQVTNQS